MDLSKICYDKRIHCKIGATLMHYSFSKIMSLYKEESRKNGSKEGKENEDIAMPDGNGKRKINNGKEGQLEEKKGSELELGLLQQKERLFELFSRLCEDSIPIVRRAAVITLGKMVAVLDDKEEIISKYIPLFNKLAQDDQDNVRVFAVETILEFSHIFSPTDVVCVCVLYPCTKICVFGYNICIQTI